MSSNVNYKEDYYLCYIFKLVPLTNMVYVTISVEELLVLQNTSLSFVQMSAI